MKSVPFIVFSMIGVLLLGGQAVAIAPERLVETAPIGLLADTTDNPETSPCCASPQHHHGGASPNENQDPHAGHPPPAETDDKTAFEPITLDSLLAPTREMNRAALHEMMLLEMRRQGSGTAWHPVDNPMMMKMRHGENWMTMLHWSAFLDYDDQGGPRGGEKWVSQNWLMASALRPVGERGILQFRSMLSAEPLTVGTSGYPLLFQTGETSGGRPLIDHQHPHDLFMELSAQYLHHLSPNTWLRLYLAPVGEPALGPIAFPHRYSAFLNPESPLSHHVQDSTHIAFGVLTAALMRNHWQVEASLFNGEEPDENRYDFDFGPLTSFSGRLTWMPNANWAMQISHGHLDDPEALEPGDIDRTTASIHHSRTWQDGWWASSLVFGHNSESGPDDNGVLIESTWNFKERNYLFGRVENIQKHGLLLDDEEADFNITQFSLGVARDLLRFGGVPLTLGAMVSVYAKPVGLEPIYGDFPMSFHVFLHTNAPRHRMAQSRFHQH